MMMRVKRTKGLKRSNDTVEAVSDNEYEKSRRGKAESREVAGQGWTRDVIANAARDLREHWSSSLVAVDVLSHPLQL